MQGQFARDMKDVSNGAVGGLRELPTGAAAPGRP